MDGWQFPYEKDSQTWVSSPWRPAHRPEHRGLDIAGPMNTPSYPVHTGEVVDVGYQDGGAGFWVNYVIDLDGALIKHFHFAGAALVKKGDRLHRDTVIGLMGSTGSSTGPHGHIERWVNGKDTDPGPWINDAIKSGRYPGGEMLTQDDLAAIAAIVDARLEGIKRQLDPVMLCPTEGTKPNLRTLVEDTNNKVTGLVAQIDPVNGAPLHGTSPNMRNVLEDVFNATVGGGEG